jgi:uncharacterized membrane protein
MIQQTNIYATQKFLDGYITPHSELNSWQTTIIDVIIKYIGFLAFMGLVQFPTTADYWSKSFLYKNKVALNAMSTNWFEPVMNVALFQK